MEDVRQLKDEWIISLKAQRRSKATLEVYSYAVDRYARWAEESGLPTDIESIRRRHIEGFIAHILDTNAPQTAATIFAKLRTFFKWLVREEELESSPMDKMTCPSYPKKRVAVLAKDEAQALFNGILSKGSFVDRRDRAILTLFVETSMRLGELVGLCVDDVDVPAQRLYVTGKGDKPRPIPFGSQSALALQRYLRSRTSHQHARLPDLWLGQRGAFSKNGIQVMVRKRGEAVGIERLHPHRFRHTFAHNWLCQGGTEVDLMALAGWEDHRMVKRYTDSAAAERAETAYHRLFT